MNTYIKILNKKEKEEIIKKLQEQFGIKSLNGIVTMRGKERLFLFQGSLDEKSIRKIEDEKIPIERLGVYFGKITPGEGIRLSIEGSQILSEQIIKNTFELSDKEAEEWMYGRDLQLESLTPKLKSGFLIMTHKGDFLGTGKASENKIGNFIPKSRRLKNRS